MARTDAEIAALLDMDLGMKGDDWRPTPHGAFLAQVLAENDFVKGKTVLELGGGVANHTIILARQHPKHLVTTEITETLLATTRQNVERNVPDAPFMEYRVADWLSTHDRFDVIVANPPFARSGKQNRRYFIDDLILNAHQRLNPGGELIFIQSSMADIEKTTARLVENGFAPALVGRTTGPFRDYYFEDATFMEEIDRLPDAYHKDPSGNYMETLHVIDAILTPYTPPASAHIAEEQR
jgi:methylase of polypeptide subunit release factors